MNSLACAEMRFVLCKLLFRFDMALCPESHDSAEEASDQLCRAVEAIDDQIERPTWDIVDLAV